MSPPDEAHIVAAPAPAVILVHGLAGDALETQRLANKLKQAGFAVHAPVIPGYTGGTGESNFEDWLTELLACIDARQREGRTVLLVGISMGATLALAACAQRRLQGVVLLGAALAYDGWAMPWYSFLVHILPLLPFRERYRYHERSPFGVKNPELREKIRRQFLAGDQSEVGAVHIPMHALEQGFRLVRHARKRLHDVRCPVLMIHAADDETVSILSAETTFDRLGATHKEMIYLGDSYHMVTVDNERETVQFETERFLKYCANLAAGSAVFETAPILSRDLRRRIKAIEQGSAFSG